MRHRLLIREWASTLCAGGERAARTKRSSPNTYKTKKETKLDAVCSSMAEKKKETYTQQV